MPRATRNDEERWDADGVYAAGAFVPLDPAKPVRVIQEYPSGDVAYITNVASDEQIARWAALVAAAPDLLRACKEARYRIEMDSDALGRKGARELGLLTDAIRKAEGPES